MAPHLRAGLLTAALALAACELHLSDRHPDAVPVAALVDNAAHTVGQLPPGRLLWQHHLETCRVRRVTLGVEYLYVEADEGTLIAIDRFSGVVTWMWRHPLGHMAAWPPVEVAGLIADRRAREAQEEQLLGQIRGLSAKTKLTEEDFVQIEKLRATRANLGREIEGVVPYDNLYLVTDNVLHCLERRSGTPLWTRNLSYAAAARPFASRNIVFVPCTQPPRVYAHAVENRGQDFAFYRSTFVDLDNFISESPLYDSPNVIFPANDGAVYAYDTRGGTVPRLGWIFNTGDTIRAPISFHQTVDVRLDKAGMPMQDEKSKQVLQDVYPLVFAAALNRTLYAINSKSGTLEWKFALGGVVNSPAVASGDMLYVRVENDSLKALEAVPAARHPDGSVQRTDGKITRIVREGRMRWQLPGGDRFVVRLSGGRVVVLGPHRELYVVDDRRGAVLSRHSTFGLDYVLTNTQDGILYAATACGQIFALTEPVAVEE
jgi:outer membrane protein assembly factor BamB